MEGKKELGIWLKYAEEKELRSFIYNEDQIVNSVLVAVGDFTFDDLQNALYKSELGNVVNISKGWYSGDENFGDFSIKKIKEFIMKWIRTQKKYTLAGMVSKITAYEDISDFVETWAFNFGEEWVKDIPKIVRQSLLAYIYLRRDIPLVW